MPTADLATLERWERLPAVCAMRALLDRAFRATLVVVSPDGVAAHRRGGVMTSSCEVCRTVLFSREGFERCDAFYRELGARRDASPSHAACHVGLAAITVPIVVGEELVAHVVASGFAATDLAGAPPPDPAALAAELLALDPSLGDPSAAVRSLPVVRGDRTRIVRAALEVAAEEITASAEAEARRSRARSGQPPGQSGIVGASARMREVIERLARVAPSDAPVLITGESGTGKELVARAIHARGPRASRAFVAQSCGAVSEEALESLLFGHVRGAFSGAVRGNEGLFGAANGGTLLLDEVSEMSPAMQVKLLRVLSDRSYLPVGTTTPREANVRIIAATNRDLAALVRDGAFREDLFYRLHVIPIRMPALRERAGDLALLVDHFLASAEGVPTQIGADAWRCLERYAWPGNVRELRAEIERWRLVASDARAIGPEHLSAPIREAGGFAGELLEEPTALAAAEGTGSLADAVEALERAILVRGLERTGGNRTQLARDLSISRTTLNERIKKFEL